MDETTIDITSFDETGSPYIEHRITERHLEGGIESVRAFGENPASFQSGPIRLLMTESQKAQIIDYIKNNRFRLKCFGSLADATHLLAFSYGENPDVNMKLATITQRVCNDFPHVKLFVQWEIANILYERDHILQNVVHRIDFNYDKNYITTNGVADKFVARELANDVSLVVVAQACCCSPRSRHVSTFVMAITLVHYVVTLPTTLRAITTAGLLSGSGVPPIKFDSKPESRIARRDNLQNSCKQSTYPPVLVCNRRRIHLVLVPCPYDAGFSPKARTDSMPPSR